MATRIAIDWFYLNRTQLSSQYGPWPLWDVIANYTAQRNNRALSSPSQEQDDSPATFGFATGALLILALSSRSQFLLGSLKTGFIFWTKRVVDQLITVAALLIFVPIILTVFVALATYKKSVAIYLNKKLLCAADAVWALDADEKTSRAVVNVLAIIDGEINLEELREIVKSKLVPASAKLGLYRKYSKLGYFYWEQNLVDVETSVRLLDGEGEMATEAELRARLSAASNAPLPEHHTAGWEVLLGPQLSPEPGQNKPRTALLFRVHHSVGDGPALCHLLLTAIADPEPCESSQTDVLSALKMRPRPKTRLLDMLVDGTTSVVAQAMLPVDHSCLHGPSLCGDKQVAWRGSAELLGAARRVRAATGAPFSAGLLAALAGAMADHVTARGAETLDTPLTVVVPARMPGQVTERSEQTKLDNAFAMTLVHMVLPTASASATARVRAAEAALLAAIQPATLVANSLALQLAGGLLPRPVAAKVLYSGQCTAVMSNMPGPAHQISLAGRTLSKLAFWVPHRGTTGVGASALSYAGQLTLGLAVDGALLTGPEDAHLLVCAWERHLLQLENSLRTP